VHREVSVWSGLPHSRTTVAAYLTIIHKEGENASACRVGEPEWRCGAGGRNAGERMKVALFGGTGFVGSYLVDELIRQAHDPVLLVRPGSEPKAARGALCDHQRRRYGPGVRTPHARGL
jgi:NAD dependent epimerase/dehydratase family